MPKGNDVLGFAADKKAVMVDLQFMDFIGLWQHFTIPIAELTEAVFDEGLGFDGSSIRGWAPIHASDMLVVPDPDTAVMDPFMKDPTLSIICNITDPITKEPYSRDPRFIAQKAERYLKQSGPAAPHSTAPWPRCSTSTTSPPTSVPPAAPSKARRPSRRRESV